MREAYGIERQESLKLRDFPTLRSVVGFVYRFRPDLKPASSQPDRGAATLPAERRRRARRLPVGAPRWRAPQQGAARGDARRRGQDAAPGARAVAAAAARAVQADRRLAREGQRGWSSRATRVASRRRWPTPWRGRASACWRWTERAPPPTSRLASPAGCAEGPIKGVFWLPALDVEPALSELDLAAFREANRAAREEPARRDARALRERGRPGPLPRQRHAHGRPARADARGRDGAARRGRGRLHEGLQARAAARPS